MIEEIIFLIIIFMTETSQSVPIGSERLKKDIVTGNFQFLDFSNREELIRQLGFYA